MTGSVSPIGNIIGLTGQAWAESASGVRPLEAGSAVFEGEKILTGPDSSVEIRFLDDTCLSQGADSTLSLDEYVYNPADEAGSKLGFGLLQGAFRHVSGKIAVSNPENVQLESPLAVIGIRGTVTVHSIRGGDGGEVHGVEHISDGHRVIIQDSFGEIRIINDPHTVIDLSPDQPMGFIRPMTPQELEFFQSFAPGVLELLGFSITPEGLAALFGGTPGDAGADTGDEGEGDESGSGAGEDGSPSEDAANSDSTGDAAGDQSADPTVSGGETSPAGTAPGDGGGTLQAGPSTTGIIAYADLSPDSTDSGLFGAAPQLSAAGSSTSDSSGPDLPPPPGVTGSPDSSSSGATSSYPEQEVLPPAPQEPTGSATSISDPSNWEYMNSGGYPNYSWLPAGYESVPGTDGSDTLSPTTGGPYALFGFGGDDYLSASANHMFYGGAGNDTIVGSSGADTIYGGTGDDVVIVQGAGQANNDIIDGGAGSNTLLLEAGYLTENVFSSDANLKNIQFIELRATSGVSAGVDLTAQSEGFTIESNTDRAAFILAGSGNDTLVGGNAYHNSLDGGAGNDLIVGGDLSDNISGGAGVDTIEAGDGNDWISGSSGADSIDGQGGINTVDYYYSDAAVRVDLGSDLSQSGGFAAGDQLRNITKLYGSYLGNDTLIGTDGDNTIGGNGGNDSIEGLGGNDRIEGSGGSDILFGGEGNDTLEGDGEDPEDDSDTLIGGAGDDVLYGRDGDDILVGGLGADEMYGEVGGDRFIYEAPGELTGDSIDGKREAATLDRIGIDTETAGQTFDLRLASDPLAPGPLASVQYVDRIDVRFDVSDLTIVLGSDIAATADSNGDDVLGDIRVEFRDGIGAHSQATSSGIIVDASGLSAGQSLFFEGEGYVDGGQLHAGFSGNDTVTGGAGNDTIFGGLGADFLIGGDGSDRFWYYTPAALANDIVDGGEEELTWDRLVIAPQSSGQTFDLATAASFDFIDVIDIDSDVAGTTLIIGPQIADTADFDKNDSFGDIRVAYRGGTSQYPDPMVNGIMIDGSGMLVDQSLFFEGEGYEEAGEIHAGFNGDDTVLGGAGNDSLEGGAGDDELDAGPGNDTLRGGLGNDSIYGGDGDDWIDGAQGNDTIDGGAGNDYILAGDGDDWIDGADGADEVRGDVGADTIYGGSGNDSLDGQVGDDMLYGGVDADTLHGGSDHDILEGGAGGDSLIGGLGNDEFVYTNLADSRTGDGVDTIADFTSGEDKIRLVELSAKTTFVYQGTGLFDGTNAQARLDGDTLRIDVDGDGIEDMQIHFSSAPTLVQSDFVWIPEGAGAPTADPENWETLVQASILGGGTPNYAWFTDQGFQVSAGYDGDSGETIGASSDKFAVFGFDGADTIDAAAISGDNYLYGGAGDDILQGGSGSDTIYGGSGNDDIDGGEGNDSILAGEGDDYIYASAGADNIDGGGGINTVDYLASDAAVNIDLRSATQAGGWAAGDSLTTIHNVYGSFDHNDTLIGTDGDNSLGGSGGDDSIDGLAGNDWIEGAQGSDIIHGGDGNDTIRGDGAVPEAGDGNDVIYGGDGDDLISGGSKNDLIYGGIGADLMYGENGEDKFVYINSNEIAGDVIVAGDGAFEQDKIEIKPDENNSLYDFSSVSITGIEKISIVSDKTSTQIYLGGNFNSVVDYNSDGIYDVKVFYEDAVNPLASKVHGVTIDASGFGSTQALYFDGNGDFDDVALQVFGQFWGDDTVYGGDANDEIHVNDGNNFVYGGNGNDTITGTDGNQSFFGQDGNDSLVGYDGTDALEGGAGDDTLIGRDGADILIGGFGSDHFVISSPSELTGDNISGSEEQGTLDILRIAPFPSDQTFDLSTASIQYIDVIEVGSDVSGTKIVLGSQIVATADLEQDGSSEPGEGEITVYFYDGTLHTTHMTNGVYIDGSDLTPLQSLFFEGPGGSDGSEYYAGFDGDDTVLGGQGADDLLGGKGNDLIDGGAGNDDIGGGDGDDTLIGGLGFDSLIGGLGADRFRIYAPAELIGDTIDGGLETGTWDFLEIEAQGESQTFDIRTVASVQHIDGVLITADISGTSVVIGPDLAATSDDYNSDGSHDVFILYDDGSSNPMSNGVRIDGSEMTSSQSLIFEGDPWGINFGFAGNDTVIGGQGEDYLTGGAGSDSLIGGLGGDRFYVASPGDLVGDIFDGFAEQGTWDRICIKYQTVGQTFDFRVMSSVQNIDRIDIVSDVAGTKLILGSQIVATADNNRDGVFGDIQVDFRDQTGPNSAPMTNGVFIDGSDLTASQSLWVEGEGYQDGGVWYAGFEGNDTIIGGAGSDRRLYGGAGDDSISGNGGNDYFSGGLGADTLIGGTGDDRFIYYHPDELTNDVVVGGSTVGESDRLVIWPGADNMHFDLHMASLTDIDRIDVYSDMVGTRIDLSQDLVASSDFNGDGTPGDVRVAFRDAYDDSVSKVHGMFIDGSNLVAGQSLYFNGDGFEQGGVFYSECRGDDTVYGGAGSDIINGGPGNDFLDAGPGDDTISGGTGNDSLYGDAGDDSLVGGDGDDTLEGASGVDTLTGGAGNDVFVYSSPADSNGGSFDTITDFATTYDKIRLVELSTKTTFVYQGTNPFSGSDAQARLDGDTLRIDVDGDGNEDMQIHFSSAPTLVQGDFVWVPEVAGYPTDDPDNWETVAQQGGSPDFTWFTDAGFQPTYGMPADNDGGPVVGIGNENRPYALFGFGGNDTIGIEVGETNDHSHYFYGGAGNDVITGWNYNDTIYGGSGIDTIIGGLGNDTLDGGDGNDWVRYDYAVLTYSIDLSTGQALGFFVPETGPWVVVETDQLISIENVEGAHGTIIGSDEANHIIGSDANDSLQGGGGNDTLIGGDGHDIAVYSGNTTGYVFGTDGTGRVTVTDIDAGDGDQGTDVLDGIEQAQFADGLVSLNIDGEFQVNTTTANDQWNSVITSLPDGGYVIAWVSGDDGDGFGIFFQRYAADGRPAGIETRANSFWQNFQMNPSIASLPSGGFVITWTSENVDATDTNIFARHFDVDGIPLSEDFQVNTTTSGWQSSPAISVLANGGYVISWESPDADSTGIFARQFDADGNPAGAEFQVNTYSTSEQYALSIASLNNGGFIVTWASDGQDGSGYGVYAQRYNSDGTRAGGEFRANTHTLNYQGEPAVAALAAGGFVIVWTSEGQDGSSFGIYGQQYNAEGNAVGAEFKVNTHTSDGQYYPDIAGLSDGGFVITWTSEGQDGSVDGIFAQLYDASGSQVGTEFLVNTNTANSQAASNVAALPDGGFVITWKSENQDGSEGGIYAQRFAADGSRIQELSGDADANTLTWSGNQGGRILGLDGDDTLTGGDGNDYIHGGEGNDSIVGGAGNDTMLGGGGDDTLAGGLGSDSILGGDGNDSVQASTGNDTIDGGTGSNTISYWFLPSNHSVFVDLSDKDANRYATAQIKYLGSTEHEQKVMGFQTVYGTVENDTIIGDTTDNTIYGGEGADFLGGGAGNDHLYGGPGNDTIEGGLGADTIAGGSENDVFAYLSVDDSRTGGDVDVIVDFITTQDKIRLENLSTKATFVYQGTNAFSGSDAQTRLVGDMLLIDVDGDGTEDMSIQLVDVTDLDQSDFIWVPIPSPDASPDNWELRSQYAVDVDTNWLFGWFQANTPTYWYLSTSDADDNLILNAVNYSPGYDQNEMSAVFAFGGNDTIDASDSNAATWLFGGAGDDSIIGGIGDSTIHGGSDNDTIHGGSGSEDIDGGPGNDSILAGDGDDLIWGSEGADTIDGGGGNNTLDFYYSNEAVNVNLGSVYSQLGGWAEGDELSNIHNLYGSGGNDTLIGTDGANSIGGSFGEDYIEGLGGDDWIEGAQGNDTIYGGDGEDWIQGDGASADPGDGDDLLDGGDGNDTILGGGGNDTLTGGLGVDSLTGGDDADVFIYTSTDCSNSVGGIDTITDFTSGTDKLQFELGTGLTLDYIVDSDFSGDGAQAEARYDGSTLYIDADGNGTADMEINLSNGTDLHIDDFSWT